MKATLHIGLVLCSALLGSGLCRGAETPENEAASVLVIFNQAMPESQEVALYYADKRQVPANQVIGFELPTTEAMTRRQYLDLLQVPLLRRLEKEKWLVFDKAESRGAERRLRQASIRYLALCYGVPIKIHPDPDLRETQTAQFPAALRKNEASVDSQLALLPAAAQKFLPWVGFLSNPAFGTTNAMVLHPTNGLFLVSRLDGPSPEVARRLVDLALKAEANGLWGRAYFDLQNTTNQALKIGDQWISQAEDVCRRYGYETEIDTNATTFPIGHPLSHVAFYAGWYGVNADGPFLRPDVDFMPGAFAYHLYSFSAATLRSKDANWVGPLLDRGAAATMGTVYEPYINLTPDLGIFFSRWLLLKFSYAEAAWASIPGVSWQNLVVGDPLYRPFVIEGKQRREELEKINSPDLQWSILQTVNRNLVLRYPVEDVIGYLEKQPLTRQSAVLTEKLGDLYVSKGKLSLAIYAYEDALKRKPSAQQKARLLMQLAHLRSYYGPDDKALAYYEQLQQEFPEYQKRVDIYRSMLTLARILNDQAKIQSFQQAIDRLSKP